MDKLKELREKLTKAITRMEEILSSGEETDFTEEQETEYKALEESVVTLKADIKAEEDKLKKAAERKAALDKEKADLEKPVNIPNVDNSRSVPQIQVLEPEEFKSLDEFLDVAFRKVMGLPVTDNRLAKHYRDSMHNPEIRATQSMVEGTSGGYMVPTQWVPELKQLAIQEAIFRPRCTIIPAGSPPDAEITLPVGDQSSNVNMGVDGAWVEEGGGKSAQDFALKEHSWIPHEYAAYLIFTDKLLRNWPAAMAFGRERLAKAMMMGEDTAFLSGNGVGKPKGILTQNCAIVQARSAAGVIAWADVRDMYWQCYKPGGSPIWIYSPTCLPQLMGISDPNTSGTMIWQPSARDGEPNRLLGIPMIENVRSPAMGSKGDLMLLNLSYYIIKDGSGPFIAASPHVYFTDNKTVVKIFFNVDGDSWLQHKIIIEGDSSNFLSPFIILDA